MHLSGEGQEGRTVPIILEGYTVEGKVIPYERFKPFLDLSDGGVWGALTGELRTELIQRGEESLAMEYPLLTAELYRDCLLYTSRCV